MGCCYSFFCKEDNQSSQNAEPNERTHLLIDPVSNTANVQSINSEDILSGNYQCEPKKTDEQSALNRILQETATNVIDVAALESHNLQHSECNERSKHYTERLRTLCDFNKVKTRPVLTCMMQDVDDALQILTSEPISSSDYLLIRNALSSAAYAIKEIEIEHKEELVVPFRIP